MAGTSDARLVAGATRGTIACSTTIAVSGAISAQAAGVMRRIIGPAAGGAMAVTAKTRRGATMIATPGRTAVVRPRLLRQRAEALCFKSALARANGRLPDCRFPDS